jgi:hypothetical protein
MSSINFLARTYQSSSSDFGHIKRSAQARIGLAIVMPTAAYMALNWDFFGNSMLVSAVDIGIEIEEAE